MSTLPEQLSAAGKSQLEAQVNFIEQVAASAVANAEQVLALNLSTTRAAMANSSAALRQLLSVKDPRDLLALTTQSQASFERLLAYGRQLFSIASSSPAALLKPAAPVIAPAHPDEPKLVEPAPNAPKVAPRLVPVAPAVPEAHAALVEPVVKSTPAAPHSAKPKPIAKAASKVAAKALLATPAAAPVPASAKPVVVTTLKAVEAAPPPAPVSGKPARESKQLDMLAPKAKKKK